MCGFVVILNRDPAVPVDRDVLEAATRSLAHRGPDDSALWVSGPVGFGFRRLAVLDRSHAGRQPMERGRRVLAVNGEVYNFQDERRSLAAAGVELRGRSDSEVLLAMLATYGLDEALRRAHGMFAFALWDGERRVLSLARDRLGQKPLFLWRGPERVMAASELKALLADPGLRREVDPRALEAYLAFFTVPEPLAAVRGVEKVLPGSLVELDARGEVLRRAAYWEAAALVAPAEARATERAAARDLRARLEQAVATHLVADVPVGAFLSGGVDSAGIAALAVKARRAAGVSEPLDTFTVAFEGSPLDESDAARKTALALGTRHHRIAVTPDLLTDLPRIAWFLDEPFGIASAAATYYLAREARRRVTVALSGDGADELLGGYPWRHAWLAPNQLVASLPRPLRLLLALAAPAGAGDDLAATDGGADGLFDRVTKWLGALGRDDAAIHADLLRGFRRADVADLLDPAWAARELDPASSPTARLEACFRAPVGADAVNRALAAEVATTLCHEMLAKVDRMSMAWGLEVRVPYLDDAVVELALGLPSDLKVGWRAGKRVLRRALAGLVPRAALQGRKRGFTVPLDEWNELEPVARDRLAALGRRAPFREGAPLRVLERHLRDRSRGHQVYALLALEEWWRVVLERPLADGVPGRRLPVVQGGEVVGE